MLRRLEGLRPTAPPAVSGWLPQAPEPPPAPPSEPAPPPGRGRLSGLLPTALHGRAFDPGRRGVAVLAAVALLGAGGGLWYFLQAAPDAATEPSAVAPITATPGGASSARAAGAAAAAAGGSGGWPTLSPSPTTAPTGAVPIVVDVVGKVVKPGVFTLPPNARVYDAIAAAGGAVPGTDLTALDLASKVADGEEIFVGVTLPSGPSGQLGGVVGGGGAGAPAGADAAPTVVNINAATVAELETLPGIGAVMAERIIAWRTQHGRFASITQLQQVSGIGPSKYAALAERVTV
ncbi:MAG: competence protein ComEA [Actinomycetota bacterium]|nr:competence protein ComEA [Actinomycetota bacterium]